MEPSPIFIVGVPRSGTTLLRMILDSHPVVMCGPEAPWIAGRGWDHPSNFRQLAEFMAYDEWGAVKGFSELDEDDVYRAMGTAIHELLQAATRREGKQRWADKTPENIVAVPTIRRMFPSARFVHVLRDGRDVALSTQRGEWAKIVYERRKVRNTYANALRRWARWVDTFHKHVRVLDVAWTEVRYEQLVQQPEATICNLLDFLDLKWSDAVLQPYAAEHDIIDPEGEGVQSFFDRRTIDTSAVFRWKEELSWFRRMQTKRIAEAMLQDMGYDPTP